MNKINIFYHEEFDRWLDRLKDNTTRLRLLKRLRRASLGNLGDVKPVGSGVFEMREHFGPGWRIYYIQRGETLIVVLAAGDKSQQDKDIAIALERAAQIES